ncbi:WecB/TagA/CpsF family glycosyltransferase [Candidatus Peregrinibacteria bacterium]|nr:MAG: WecB/TagA/CpsF family glycosyltransferase [Candidatus Peregrinibacteria bacterium]
MNHRLLIAGVPIDRIDYEGVLKKIAEWTKGKTAHQIVTVNPEMILRCQQDDEFKRILQESSLNTADGTGALWAADYLNLPQKRGWQKGVQLFFSLMRIILRQPFRVIPERVTGSDLLPKLVERSHRNHWKLFFLGADKGVAKQAKEKLLKHYPDAHIVDCFDGSPSDQESSTAINRINKSGANILLVAYGNPKQEQWIQKYLQHCHNVRAAIGVGGSFDFYAERIKRAPNWLQQFGLEWLWRLLKEPQRYPRIWNATVGFVHLIYRLKNEKITP